MTRVAVLSANLGSYDPHVDWVEQRVPAGVTVDVHRFTDANFPPRPLAMTSRLQAGIPKMFGWELRPGYDVYIWIDASRGLLRDDTVAWFLDQLLGQTPGADAANECRRLPTVDLVLFKHPERATIRAEYEFVKTRLARRGETYLTSRYAGEWLDQQYQAIWRDVSYVDDRLYASTAFAYRNIAQVKRMLIEWWVHKSQYLLHDQLALPYVVWKSGCSVRALEDSVYTCPHLPMTRGTR